MNSHETKKQRMDWLKKNVADLHTINPFMDGARITEIERDMLKAGLYKKQLETNRNAIIKLIQACKNV